MTAFAGTAENTRLFWAAIKGELETVKAMLNQGADINVQKPNGDTALIAAAQWGHVGMVRSQAFEPFDQRKNSFANFPQFCRGKFLHVEPRITVFEIRFRQRLNDFDVLGQ